MGYVAVAWGLLALGIVWWAERQPSRLPRVQGRWNRWWRLYKQCFLDIYRSPLGAPLRWITVDWIRASHSIRDAS